MNIVIPPLQMMINNSKVCSCCLYLDIYHGSRM